MLRQSTIAFTILSLFLGLLVGLLVAQNDTTETTAPDMSTLGLVGTTRWLSSNNPPVGSVLAFAGKWDYQKTIDTGWMLCKGQELLSRDYPELAAALDVSGATIVLPNLGGRSVIGSGCGEEGNVQLTERVLNEHGGEESHALSIDEMPEHDHGVSDPGHSHDGLPTDEGVIGEGGKERSVTSWFNGKKKTASNTTGITIAKAGESKPHNNMHPYWVLHYIIKVRSITPQR